MAKFIAISGPSYTGKSLLVDELKKCPEMKEAIFSPDFHNAVWVSLVEKGLFSEYMEISTDSDYLCMFIFRMIDYYKDFISSLENTDKLVILDGSWIDISVYAVLSMWYTRAIKSLQERVMEDITYYDDRILRIYITTAEDEKYPVERYRIRGRVSNFRMNRPLEIKHYEVYSNLKNATKLPTTDVDAKVKFILEDLRKLGYLQ